MTPADPFPDHGDRKVALLAARQIADAQQELLRYQAEGAVCNWPFGDSEVMIWLAAAIMNAGYIEREILACQPCYANYREGLTQMLAAVGKFLTDHGSVDPYQPGEDEPA